MLKTRKNDLDLSLAFSPCPNDTFIFFAIAYNLIDCEGIEFKIRLADVETLNQKAKAGVFDISKLSFAAIGYLQDRYSLLRSGAALGRGCGPLIVAKPGFNINKLKLKKIAVPGLWTTANLLLCLYLSKKPDVYPISFEQIMPSVEQGIFDAGVIIHEGRFTYKKYGLELIVDLGSWWEAETSLPIPLGGIAIRKGISAETVKKIERIIRESVLYAYKNRNKADDYIKKHAQELAPSVIRQHIDLYVNEFTLDLGDEGEEAVKTLFKIARERGILPLRANSKRQKTKVDL